MNTTTSTCKNEGCNLVPEDKMCWLHKSAGVHAANGVKSCEKKESKNVKQTVDKKENIDDERQKKITDKGGKKIGETKQENGNHLHFDKKFSSKKNSMAVKSTNVSVWVPGCKRRFFWLSLLLGLGGEGAQAFNFRYLVPAKASKSLDHPKENTPSVLSTDDSNHSDAGTSSGETSTGEVSLLEVLLGQWNHWLEWFDVHRKGFESAWKQGCGRKVVDQEELTLFEGNLYEGRSQALEPAGDEIHINFRPATQENYIN